MVPQCKSAASPPGSAAVPVQRFSSSEERTCGSWVQTSSSSIEHKKAFLNPSHPSTTPKPQFALPKRSDAESAASMPKAAEGALVASRPARLRGISTCRTEPETGRDGARGPVESCHAYAWLRVARQVHRTYSSPRSQTYTSRPSDGRSLGMSFAAHFPHARWQPGLGLCR